MTLKRIFRVILSMTPEVYPEKSRMFMDLNSYDTFFWKLKIMVILKKEKMTNLTIMKKIVRNIR